MTDVPNATELVQRGQAAARVGLRDEAREYLREAVQLAPDNVEAWLDLAGVENDPAAKGRALKLSFVWTQTTSRPGWAWRCYSPIWSLKLPLNRSTSTNWRQ